MKRMKKLLCMTAVVLLGSACQDNGMPEAVPEPWNITVSRAIDAPDDAPDDTYNRIWVLGKEGETTRLNGVLAVNGTSSSWEGATPSWPTDKTLDVYAISPVPEDNVPPQAINLTTGKGTAWQIDYLPAVSQKPTNLTMTHLLAKLVVHIRIDSEANPQPTDGKIRLKAEGTIDYATKTVTLRYDEADVYEVPLGSFHQEGQADHSTEHNWEMEEAIVVIPQTIQSGQPCLWFTAGGQTYTFTPQNPLELRVGKVNNLYLGVAADNTSLEIYNSGNTIGGYGDGSTQSGEAD